MPSEHTEYIEPLTTDLWGVRGRGNSAHLWKAGSQTSVCGMEWPGKFWKVFSEEPPEACSECLRTRNALKLTKGEAISSEPSPERPIRIPCTMCAGKGHVRIRPSLWRIYRYKKADGEWEHRLFDYDSNILLRGTERESAALRQIACEHNAQIELVTILTEALRRLTGGEDDAK